VLAVGRAFQRTLHAPPRPGSAAVDAADNDEAAKGVQLRDAKYERYDKFDMYVSATHSAVAAAGAALASHGGSVQSAPPAATRGGGCGRSAGLRSVDANGTHAFSNLCSI
jgi:hypothetical protein